PAWEPDRERGGAPQGGPVAAAEPAPTPPQGEHRAAAPRARGRGRGGAGRGGGLVEGHLGHGVGGRDRHAAFAPVGEGMLGQTIVEKKRVLDAEVIQQGGQRPLENHRALVNHGHGVELVQFREIVDHAEHGALLLGDESAQHGQDLVLGAGVEAAGDLVTKEAGGLGGEFEGEAETAELSAGEFLHHGVGALGEADETEQGGEAAGVVGFPIQAQRGGERLGDGEFAVGDAELGGEGDLAQKFFGVGDAAAAQQDVASRGEDAEQALEQGGLAAAGRADEGMELSGGEIGVGTVHEGGGTGAGQDIKLTAGEHGRKLRRPLAGVASFWRATFAASACFGGWLLTRWRELSRTMVPPSPASPSPADDPDATVRTPPRRSEPDSDHTVRALRAGDQVFGRYTLQRVLGRGGMGVVWLARDASLETDVALKFLPEVVVLDEGALRDLKKEALRSRELTHAHIVRIHDFVEGEGCAAIAMEYIDGSTLAKRRLDQPGEVFSPEALLPWVRQLAEALDYAHTRARVVHRDLKPANLMVNSRGELKVADFGISATLTDTATRLSRTLVGSSGSPPYMSPQQMLGKKPAVSDDVYALGATLYELLTGKPPFYTGNILLQVQTEAPSLMTERRAELHDAAELAQMPSIAPAWEQTIAACLAKDSAARPASVGEVYLRLSGTQPLHVAPTAGRGVERDAPPAPATRPSPWRWVAGAVGAAVIVLGAWLILRPQPETPAVVTAADLDVYLVKTVPRETVGFDLDSLKIPIAPKASATSGEAAAAGSLVLQVTPAEVAEGLACTVDGKAAMSEGGGLRDLEVGKHTITVSHPDYEPWSGGVEVKDGATANVQVVLVPKPGKLAFITTPQRAYIRLTGGEFKDATFTVGGLEIVTPYRKALPPGDYTVRYTLEGYAAAERSVTVRPNRTTEVAVNLEKQTSPD
ncbi:MAG: hypothetical protein RIQ79_2002, partial [Verrucomicrobiota bacterium]